MPEIYTAEWYEALRRLLNSNPEVERNAPDGTYNVLAEIKGDARSAYLGADQRRVFVIRFENRKCRDYSQVENPPPRRQFDFIFELPASVFEGIAAGTIDPVDAGLKGTIKITGDMRILIKHAALVNAVYGVYASEVETIWPNGKPTPI
jgi:putative sterol carrier protein